MYSLKMNPHDINAGHQPLTFVKHAHKRRVISKREAKKPKNTKRRVKFNKKEFEKKLQQQEKEEKESGVAKDESTVDTSEVLSSSNSLIPESGKERGGSSSTYESYSESSDSEDKNDIDDDDEDDDDSSDDDDEEEDDDSSDTSEDKTESTEEISLTSEEEKKSKDVSMSAIPHSGPDSSPPASSDSTDESSGSKAISGSSSDVSYTMSSDASVYSSSEENYEGSGSKSLEEGSASNEKAKTKSEKKAKIKAAHKTKKGKRVKLGKKSSKNRINVNDNNLKLHPLSDEKEHSLNKKTAEDHSLRLEMTTGNVLYMEKDEHLKEKSKQLSDREVHFQVTTERVLNLHNAAKKEEPYRSAAGSNPSSSRRKVSTNGGSLASKERPAMELLKVKPADPNRKSDLEQELIKDYPENGTVEITNWAGTFAPIHGEPYVAPLHHQPDEFWDAIYTSKDPDLPTPPGADVSEEATVKPLKGPEISMRRLATMLGSVVSIFSSFLLPAFLKFPQRVVQNRIGRNSRTH
ncbi:dentin sialophosphoprotein-like [Macrosteles quadrilineatus]|uniref:dentin sialophosphoprotein-like n=1 Tax=Macrosteles quadrilineatus TaxID=74068 RepID=UPI0023E0A31E|nr:dentin sialophosphoprotein-like [Macrosteles quadrilineatus]